MAFRDFLNRVGNSISNWIRGGDSMPPLEEQGPVDVPVEEEPIPELPGDPIVPMYDDHNEFVGAYTQDQWYQYSLYTREEMFYWFSGVAELGRTWFNNRLSAMFGIPWDWETWKAEYEARNG